MLSTKYVIDYTEDGDDIDQATYKVIQEFDNLYTQLNNMRTAYRGNTEPADKEAGLIWEDTAHSLFRIRNSSNSNWNKLFKLDIDLCDDNGILSSSILPKATDTVLGAVKVGTGIAIDAEGKINITPFPSGIICMWSGSIENIPTGWVLCNGQNNTPDLRDRFILGAGSTYSIGQTGGESTHKLTIPEMPSHYHTISPFSNQVQFDGPNNEPAWDARFGGSVATSSVGGDQAHNNMPPYFALAYIMKV